MPFVTTIGVIIPINDNGRSAKPPVPEPDDELLRLVRYVTDAHSWALLWVLADEEGCAPEVASDINWLLQSASRVGERHILRHGFQFGAPLLVVFEVDEDGDTWRACPPAPDLGLIGRHDWSSGEKVP